MKYQEVENLFFDYEEKRNDFIQKTQKYFLEKGFNPYVWFDEQHKLRIKYKYPRQSSKHGYSLYEERQKFMAIANNYAEENDLKIRFILDLRETDTNLSLHIRILWSTEIIFEVKI